MLIRVVSKMFGNYATGAAAKVGELALSRPTVGPGCLEWAPRAVEHFVDLWLVGPGPMRSRLRGS